MGFGFGFGFGLRMGFGFGLGLGIGFGFGFGFGLGEERRLGAEVHAPRAQLGRGRLHAQHEQLRQRGAGWIGALPRLG